MKPSMANLAAKYKFNRTKSHRDAMLRNLTTQVLQHNSIITTETKCAAVQQIVEKCITFAKKRNSGSPADKQFYTEKLLQNVFFKGESENLLREKLDKLATETYKNRNNGFTRIIRLEPKQFDKSPQSMIELVDLPIFNKETGDVIKGNMKLWLLMKTIIKQESENELKPLTLQNLNKMIKLKSEQEIEEFFFTDLLQMRKLIKLESQELKSEEEFNEAEELKALESLKAKVAEFNELKKLEKLKYHKGYNKLESRPEWQNDVKPAANY